MRSCVGGLQARRLYPSVDLRRAHGAVAEQLLDRAQVGAPVEQVRRERMPQRVRRDPTLHRRVPRPRLQPPPDVGGGQPPAALGEEQRRRPIAALQSRATALEPALDGAQGRLAGRDDPRLAAFSLDPDLLVLERDARDVEVDELLRAQSARVRDLEQGAVAQLQRRRRRDAVQQRGDLRRAPGRAAASPGAWARGRGRPGSPAPRRARAGRGRAGAAPPACGPWSPVRPGARRAPARSGAARVASRRPDRGRCASTRSRAAPRRSRTRGASAPPSRGDAGRRPAAAGPAARTR